VCERERGEGALYAIPLPSMFILGSQPGIFSLAFLCHDSSNPASSSEWKRENGVRISLEGKQ